VRLSAKWFLWFTGIGIYVMFLGGIFYFNLFKWTFDEKLKQESIDMVRLYAPTLIEGLSRNQGAITMAEFDTVTRFSKDDRVASLLYLNKYGEVRWFKDPSMITKTFDDFRSQVNLPTDAIEQAWLSKTPIVRAVPNLPLYDIAIPLALRGDVLGVLDMQVSREGVVKVINKAMNKYAIGAVGVLLLLGIPLYFFLHHFVINPLMNLRDAIESISFKSLDLKFAAPADEIGELSGVIGIFLSKVKAEIANSMVKEKQRGVAEARWWESILRAVVSKNHRAIVVDEDNTVLYTNFPLTGTVTTDGKMHLLDVIDSQQQDVLRLVSVALDNPNQVKEADTMFRSEPCHVKAVHLDEDGETKRTLILFEPKSAGVRI
jgi:HAMP domain-containing protein